MNTPIPNAILRSSSVTPAASLPPAFSLPMFGSRVPAGFPSPAEDYIEKELDANELLVTNPAATYFVKVSGQSMRGCWVRDGDIVVVDCSITPRRGMVVVAVLDGEMLVKQLDVGSAGEPLLKPSNARYPTITVQEGQDFLIWGIVTWSLHRQAHS
ncbi:MAG: translesion error-prone DNA polymerase V autoproteolytic subunit [Moraxellaceae bacterium]|nr:translesion error-prone DNA polymerase V autoproteolytic subunit [Moraxellaceae bacterium]